MKVAFVLALFAASGNVQPQQIPNDIVFTGNDRVYVVRADGTGQTAITSPAARTDHPRWSRDGGQIVFTKINSTGDGYAVWKMNAHGENQTFVFNVYGNGLDIPGQPVFSPNADSIAFVTCDCFDPVDIIGIANADGRKGVEVTYAYIRTYGLDWAPVGERLAFSELRFEQGAQFYRISSINTNGSDELALTTRSQGNNFDSVWSPDGSKIAFASDRDGNSEIYTMNSNGSNQLRVTNSTAGDFQPTWSPDGTKLAFTSNRNGPYNIFMMNADGTNAVQVTHNAFDSFSPHWNPSAGPHRKSPFDFDGDGKTDIGVVRQWFEGLRQFWIRNSSTGTVNAVELGVWIGTDSSTPADFTGDGRTDLAIYDWYDGTWQILRSEDSTYYSVRFGAPEDFPVPADFDGDDKDDIAIYRASTGTWWILGSSSGLQIKRFGASDDRPVPADYDGDGKADIAVFKPSDGTWWIDGSQSGTRVFHFGNATDTAIPGDYTGDGKADVAVWRRSEGNWYVLRSEDGSYFAAHWGMSGDIPAPGDYDGDGKFDMVVFREREGLWYLYETSGGIQYVRFGQNADRPIASSFIW